MTTLEKLDFIKVLKGLKINVILKETTVDFYPGRMYALDSSGHLAGYWSELNGYVVFDAPMRSFSKSRRQFQKIKLEDL
jgi:hypothetical protein